MISNIYKEKASIFIKNIEASSKESTASQANILLDKSCAVYDSYKDIGNKILFLQYVYNNCRHKNVLDFIAGYLSVYEPVIARKIYCNLEKSIPGTKFFLDNWDNINNDLKIKNIEKINKYNKWKKKNNFTFLDK